MHTVESRRGRRIVAHLGRGADLLDDLQRSLLRHGVSCAEVRAVGSLESVALTTYDRQARAWREPRRASGELEVVWLSGNAVLDAKGAPSLHLRASLCRETELGPQMIAGVVAHAVVFDLEVIIDAIDDVVIERRASAEHGLLCWNDLRLQDPAPDAVAPERPIEWSDVIAASDASTRAEPSGEGAPTHVSKPASAPASSPTPSLAVDGSGAVPVQSSADPQLAPGTGPIASAPRIGPGDLIEHPRFKRCTVQRIEGDYEFIHVALKNGRVVRLSLDVVELTQSGTDGGQRVFIATIL